MNLAERRAPKPAPRINPLIGGIQRSTPKQQETEPAAAPAAAPTAPTTPKTSTQSTQSTANFIPPPPPPPPSSSVLKTDTPGEATAASNHTYSATSKAVPFELDVSSIISSKAADFGRSLQQEDPLTRPRVRSAASTGRTVFVRTAQGGGANTAPTVKSALAALNRLVKTQHIKNKYHSQKSHERPGLKRKRLASERWRARFKTGFCAAYVRVHELRKQGW